MAFFLLLSVLLLLLGLCAAQSPFPAAAAAAERLEEEGSPWLGLPEELLQLLHPEVEPECRELLAGFANSSVRLSGCLVRHARPVTVCQNCYRPFREVTEHLENISRAAGNTTESNPCAKSLLMSDRLQIVLIMSNFFNATWKKANCANCLKNNSEGLSNSTVTFLALFNESMACFEHNLQRQEDSRLLGNISDVCKNCNVTYKKLNDMYNKMQKSGKEDESEEEYHLCIDVEDAMNITRRLWSTSFNCSIHYSDTVPMIAVSSFILFLPVVFYLSSFLHSKQKKRILMPSKRFQSNDSSVNIQEKSTEPAECELPWDICNCSEEIALDYKMLNETLCDSETGTCTEVANVFPTLRGFYCERKWKFLPSFGTELLSHLISDW